MEEKIARICWNDYEWQKPSGIAGKSKNKKSFEYETGYGHEEWLLDTEKVINGFHYGFLQAIGNNHKKFCGKIFNVSFYSINAETRKRFWVGKCNNLQVISEDESQAIYSLYKQKGWLKEMAEQLKVVGADYKKFLSLSPDTFFNIKYKPLDLVLVDTPQNFSNKDRVIKATYYNVLLNKINEPALEIPLSEEEFEEEIKFIAGHNPKKKSPKIHYRQREADANLFHDRMQENVYKQLSKIYPNNVRTELRGVDLVVRDKKGSYIFYEFKTFNSLKKCVREALSQLLEYAYYPNAKRAVKLVIVSQNIADSKAKKYLEKLRKEFGIPVFYKRYNPEICELENVYY